MTVSVTVTVFEMETVAVIAMVTAMAMTVAVTMAVTMAATTPPPLHDHRWQWQ